MGQQTPSARLRSLDRAFGDETRRLVLGRRTIRLEGLDRELAESLGRRWGGFLRSGAPRDREVTLRVLRAGDAAWLDREREDEHYRMELSTEPRPAVISYNFAVDGDRRGWRVGVTEGSVEPVERILDNATRYVTARLAIEDGGLALHAAGVVRDGRAYLLAGPSRAGKTTAVSLATGAGSLGDDFGIVVRREDGWAVPALPFDNSERVDGRPTQGEFPLAEIWRLYQARENRVEKPVGPLAVASLMSCVAFPWTMPEQSQALLAHAQDLISDDCYRHLHFSKGQELWTDLV